MALSDEDLLEVAKYALTTGDESVTEQYQEVQSVRLRASFLVTVNGLSSTLFAQFLQKPIQIDLLLALAVLLFVVCNFFALRVMIPSGNWRITKSASKIIEDFADGDQQLSAGQVFGVLAIKTDEDQVKNEEIVRFSHSNFLFSVFAFAGSTMAWIFHLSIVQAFVNGVQL